MTVENYAIILNTREERIACTHAEEITTINSNIDDLYFVDAIEFLRRMRIESLGKKCIECFASEKYHRFNDSTLPEYTYPLNPIYVNWTDICAIRNQQAQSDKKESINDLLNYVLTAKSSNYIDQFEIVPLPLLMKVVYGLVFNNQIYLIEAEGSDYRYRKFDRHNLDTHYLTTSLPMNLDSIINTQRIIDKDYINKDLQTPIPFTAFNLLYAKMENRSHFIENIGKFLSNRSA